MVVGAGVPKGVTLRSIPGLDATKYQAGSDGHIYCYSDARVNAKRPRPFRVSEAIGSNGYPFVAIIERDRKRTMAVHGLVCSAFHGVKANALHEVRHLDGDRKNNLSDNLSWGSAAENEADKRRHGRAAIGSAHGGAVLNEEAVRILRAAIPSGLWNPTDAAKVFGVEPSAIRDAVRGRSWKHVGLGDCVPCRARGRAVSR